MAMGREGEVQGDLVMTWAEMPRSPGHAFYDKLQTLLTEGGFDGFVQTTCKPYYAPRMGAPSLPPGRLPIPTKPPVYNGMIAPRDSWMMPPLYNEMIPPGAPRALA